MTTYTFKTLPFELRNTSAWPAINTSEMSEEDKARFLRLKAGIETYLATGRLLAASKIASCGQAGLLRMLNRCVSITHDGDIFGWAGLIKHLRVKSYERRRSHPIGYGNSSGDYSGSFKAFLKTHEAIRELIDALILKHAIKEHAHHARISYKDLTREFRNLCIKFGVQEDEYPLNTQSKGRQSIARYAKQLISENSGRATWSRYGDGAWKHLQVGTGKSTLFPEYMPMRAWSLDAHKIDCIGCLIVQGPSGPQRIAIERLWFVPVVDTALKAVMGYSVGIRTEISAETVEQAILNAISPWNPRILSVAGAQYIEGAALPSFTFPELVGCSPAFLKVDNAVQHYAKRISEHVRTRLGCAVAWGGIGRWDHNAIVERLFRTLEVYGFHKLPSTTGSSPQDPIRRDSINEAMKLGIDWPHLLDLLDVIVAEYNATPHRGLGGRSPLEACKEYLEPSRPRILLRPLPEASMMVPDLGVMTVVCTVRGNQKAGIRPYVQWEHARYTSPLLARSFHRIHERVVLHLKVSDVSRGNAFTIEGESLGELIAAGAWGRVGHSLDIRKEIGKLINDATIRLAPGEDIVTQYLRYYARKARSDSQERPKRISRAATKLAKSMHESGQSALSTEDFPVARVDEPKERPVRVLSGLVKSPDWKTIV